MKINSFLLPILLIAALLGTTFTAQALGIWSTSGRDAVDVTKLTPADIKGWMTLQQLIDGLPISQTDLYRIGDIPSDTPPSTALKDLEAIISVTTLREKLSAPSDSTANAVAMPTLAATPIPGATATAKALSGEAHVTATPLPTGQILPADQIKGKLTLKEVSEQCAVPLDKLVAALKLNPTQSPATPIKDLIAQGKIGDVTDVQKIVAELQRQ